MSLFCCSKMVHLTHVCVLIYATLIVTSQAKKHKTFYKIAPIYANDKPAIFSHAESPVWDVETQSLFFVDVHSQNVNRYEYASEKLYTKHIGYGQVNVVALVAGSRKLLVAVRSALYLMDWNVTGDAALRLLTTVDQGLPDNVINEGKADGEGRFLAGTKGPQVGDDVQPDKASLYSFEPDQEGYVQQRVVLRPVSISNGLAFALNNTIMYYIDSATQKIEAFDYDAQRGEISGRRTILDITSYGYDEAIPDGLTIDSDGHLWVALMFGGTILHIDPEARKVVYGYKLPGVRTTSLCWGGPNLDELYVTTGREKDTSEPLAGAIFTIKNTGSRGIPAHTFRYDNADYY